MYINVNEMFPDSKWSDFKGCGFVIEMIRRYGIRSVELGYMAWELDRYIEKHEKMSETMPPNLVRLAIPPNVYNKEHMDYVADSIIDLYENHRSKVPRVTIEKGKDTELRHFSVCL